jgi:23S rRNA pseudouridine1911/1915/1917 synthase
MLNESFIVASAQTGATLAAAIRAHMPGQSWSQVRKLIAGRRVRVGGELCLDPARRLNEGESVEVMVRAAPKPRQHDAIVIRFVDEHLVVVEKPAGLSTVRHPSERAWSASRKAVHPTLEDLVPGLIARQEGRSRKGVLPRLRVVQRLDKETSGLVVFARTVLAERSLGRQFKTHSATRQYLALIQGYLAPQRIVSRLVRDRGDRRRGSTALPGVGKEAVTHVRVAERLPGFTLLSCNLETGRTHQIRIHLAELGHPICGEKVYNKKLGGAIIPDRSAAPRLALHACELGFTHPRTGASMHWTMPMAADLASLLEKLRLGG